MNNIPAITSYIAKKCTLQFDIIEYAYAITSATFWKKYNGPVYLYCDAFTKDEFEKRGMLELYDEVFSLPLCFNLYKEHGINHTLFWAISKYLALEEFGYKSTAVLLDLDCVVFEPLKLNPSVSLTGLHWDNPFQYFYMDNEFYRQFELQSLDLNTAPINCGIIHYQYPEIMSIACKEMLRFCRAYTDFYQRYHHLIPDVYPMMFSEQRLLPALFKAHGQRVDVFESLSLDDITRQLHNDRISHLWGCKTKVTNDNTLATNLINFLQEKLQSIDADRSLEILSYMKQQK